MILKNGVLMNVFVCLKQVPDTETKIQISGGDINTQSIKWVMNPYDEFAVEEALKFKAANPSAIVTVISLGPKTRVSETLRTALAMGADEAVVIDVAGPLDHHLTAKALAGALRTLGQPSLILTGKLAIDDNASAVTQMLAEYLDLPHVTGITKAEYSGSSVTVESEREGGSREIIEVKLPAILGANKGLNIPRYASLPGIMKAKKKTIKELSLSDVGASEADLKLKFTDFQLPPERPQAKLLAGAAAEQASQLVKLLREEAKVI